MQPTEMEEYLFDLRGYIVLKNAVDAEHLAEINAIVDTYNDLEPDGWRGWVHRRGGGSHKSNLLHPAFEDPKGTGSGRSLDRVEAAVQIQLDAGDAIFFVDCMAHGSSERTRPGERRVAIIRYSPHWGNDRYGYQPSPELIARLTSERRKIIQPLPPKMPPGVQWMNRRIDE